MSELFEVAVAITHQYAQLCLEVNLTMWLPGLDSRSPEAGTMFLFGGDYDGGGICHASPHACGLYISERQHGKMFGAESLSNRWGPPRTSCQPRAQSGCHRGLDPLN